MLVGRVVVDDEVDVESLGHGLIDALEEGEELLMAVARPALGEDRAGGDVEGGKQRGGAVADIIVGDAFDIAIQGGRPFAWQTRLRQVEEIYFRALYCIFFATPEELPHIFSGAMPNSVTPMYRKVNEVILEGRGQWEVPQAGKTSGQFTPLDILHSAAHASYAAIFTAISLANAPESQVNTDGYIKHLNMYCDRLEYMHKMFAAGRDKQVVLEPVMDLAPE